jgi:hypothetical protein
LLIITASFPGIIPPLGLLRQCVKFQADRSGGSQIGPLLGHQTSASKRF